MWTVFYVNEEYCFQVKEINLYKNPDKKWKNGPLLAHDDDDGTSIVFVSHKKYIIRRLVWQQK